MGKITFKVNDIQCQLEDKDVYSDMMLVDYLRTRLCLHGTKFMCREGGCGACIVSANTPRGTIAVNSCLVSVAQCHNWEITTVEKVGSKGKGYHPIQTAVAEHHGTQCGHCTPGWIMAMYSRAQNHKDMTKSEIEKSFGSNICRCTGYRPILDAFKTFAVDAPDSRIADIEDLYICKKTNKACNKSCHEADNDDDWCIVSNLSLEQEEPIKLEFKDGKTWYKVTEIDQIFSILANINDDDYMFVCGNTAKGPFPIDEYPNHMFDISTLEALKGYSMDQNLVVGANNTLHEFMDICETVSQEENFDYLDKFYHHIELIAHIPVRNIGSIAGNLMTKYKHNQFQSDIFLLLETVGAYVTIMDSQRQQEKITMLDFLKVDMKKKIIFNILLPPLGKDVKIETIKVMPRAQSSPALVNAGFYYQLSSNNTVRDVRIVYGNLSPVFVRATKTEEVLKGKALFTNETLQLALKELEKEIIVEEDLPAPPVEYRKKLALGLFYKGLLKICPDDAVGARFKSGRARLHESRPVSQAKQEFTTKPNQYPLTQPLKKVEAVVQCSGEAQYTDDLPTCPQDLYAALVLATIAKGKIESIDASEALKMQGVTQFFSAKDIPGKNSFMLLGVIVFVKDEEVFCSDEVKYYNQPIGVIVAESTQIAERAAKRVKVTYSNVKKPVIDIRKARKDKTRTKLFLPIPNLGRGISVKEKFETNYTVQAQMHFCMESIATVAKPSEHGLEVHCSTQWMDAVQYTIAKALDIPMSQVDVFTRRLGGGFGLKLTRASLSAVACSLAAYKLDRTVRLIQPFSTTARAIGKRFPCSCDIKVEVSKNGLIQYMDIDTYEDNGYIVSELVSLLGVDSHNNCYKRLWWNYKCYDSTTDTARNTYCRSPGSVENIAMAETLMNQIAFTLSLDPWDVRVTNMDTLLHAPLKKMSDDMRKKTEYDKRKAEVEKFNSENRWVKRGICPAMMKYNPLCPAGFEVSITICHGDGSVVINHAGIEMGQGINTKAIQVCAYLLKVPVEKIHVKPQNSITGPNSIMTAASLTSQSIVSGVDRCCKELNLRLAPIRILLLNASWEQVVKKAHFLKIPLTAREYVNDILAPIYTVHALAVSEIEVDILTGELQVRRVDLCEDVGQSISPQIDVGQVEGAFIMGMSYYMWESVVYDEQTGEVKSDRPFNYHVAQCRDIPQDFRISFQEGSYSAPSAFGAKVTGEPATGIAIAVPLSARLAIDSARREAGVTSWFDIVGSYTADKLCLAAETKIEHMVFK